MSLICLCALVYASCVMGVKSVIYLHCTRDQSSDPPRYATVTVECVVASTRLGLWWSCMYRMYVYGDQGIALGPYITYKYIRLYGLIRNQLARKLKLLAVPLAGPHTPGARAQAPGQVSVNHKQLLEQ